MNHAIIELTLDQLPKDTAAGTKVELSLTGEVTDTQNAIRVTEVRGVNVQKESDSAEPKKTASPSAKSTSKK